VKRTKIGLETGQGRLLIFTEASGFDKTKQGQKTPDEARAKETEGKRGNGDISAKRWGTEGTFKGRAKGREEYLRRHTPGGQIAKSGRDSDQA